MKSLIRLLQYLLADASEWCRASTTRDFEEISSRIEHEGISFLTITLPRFGTDFERSLELKSCSTLPFYGFKRIKGRAVPEFLRGLTWLVFDPVTGVLLDNPDTNAIFFVRQITLAAKKILLPCSNEREYKAYQKYIQCEHEITVANELLSQRDLTTFGLISDILYGSKLQSVNSAIENLEHVPRHGSGATADRIVANAKYDITTWHTRLETYFPADFFCIPSWNYIEKLESIDFVEPGAEHPSRVISVPKTLKTPRIIAIEPVCMQYAQQSILELLVPALEHNSFKGSLGFSDQSPNREFAMSSSKDGRLATLDLSEASDRVHNQLVKRMLRSLPALQGATQACRSTTADVPHFGVIPLVKFASMGSALCFPMEAMTFLVIVVKGILEAKNVRITKDAIDRVLGRVRIYGDDIIVPVEYAQSVMRELEIFGLLVNKNKTFVTGKFRESCGMDAYDGVDVTPVYVRRMLPASRHDTSEILSAVSLRNQLYEKGCWKACQYLTLLLRKFAKFPVVLKTSPLLGFISFLGYEAQRYNRQLCRFEAKGLTVYTRPRKSLCGEIGSLMKFFLKRGSRPFDDPKHLERYGRPDFVGTKVRWATPF